MADFRASSLIRSLKWLYFVSPVRCITKSSPFSFLFRLNELLLHDQCMQYACLTASLSVSHVLDMTRHILNQTNPIYNTWLDSNILCFLTCLLTNKKQPVYSVTWIVDKFCEAFKSLKCERGKEALKLKTNYFNFTYSKHVICRKETQDGSIHHLRIWPVISRWTEERDVDVFCDLWGNSHSREWHCMIKIKSVNYWIEMQVLMDGRLMTDIKFIYVAWKMSFRDRLWKVK